MEETRPNEMEANHNENEDDLMYVASDDDIDDDEACDDGLSRDEPQTSTSSVPLDSSSTSHGSTYTSDEEVRSASKTTKQRRHGCPVTIPKKYGDCSPEELVVKRKAANVLERRRMRKLNEALVKLKKCLPREYYPYQRKLSKIRTLRSAISYIDTLTNMLKEPQGGVPDRKLHDIGYSLHPGFRGDCVQQGMNLPHHVPSVPGLFSSVFSPMYPSTPVQNSSSSSDSSPNTFYPSPPDSFPFTRQSVYPYQSSPMFPVPYGFPALYQATEESHQEEDFIHRHKRFRSSYSLS